MTKICLIRHGETDWNAMGKIQGKTDIPLNENGTRQAQQCRDYLKDSNWDIIVTSPLKRAKQTAFIINEALQLQVVEMAEFMERSFGDAEGKTREERAILYPDQQYPNQESREELVNRIMNGLEKILVQFLDQKVLLVAHGAVIHTLLTVVSEDQLSIEKYLSNACISNIHFKEKKWVVEDYNLVDHLVEIN
ncbi:histidine phosphatase family protein [Cytobacillus oceanisediminis]|uniref:Histidine phosphatase family protein n=1 Tax=Niallia alba TaxID=2729105 RepID=A0A7Y0KAJ8_9BACI|nr:MULTISPECIES: histidine phosphatase family protein [Bacillaceae]EOR23753.1 phosphatase YhfR [Niallia nealsonii AAU1]MBZ9536052.1 histidine phosphatase family protein [Cytobacillus oceanisediminis]NMO78867.1 histidine phosphatase family protein [Niallia alba]